MPLTILAAANAAVAAIQQGCELYKEYKGTVLKAKATFDEVKGIAVEVSDVGTGIWAFLKSKLTSSGLFPSSAPTAPTVQETTPAKKVKKRIIEEQHDEASITADLIKNLKIFFKCLEELQNKVAEAKEKSLNVDNNTLESALDIEFAMSQAQELQKQIRETMVYNSPKELGDLYTKVVNRVGVIQEQQELARIARVKKTREEQWRREHLLHQAQSRVIWVVTALLIIGETWLILLAVMKGSSYSP
jgi:vacuolar-type H+-ATPase subunit I/STV1